MTVRMKQKTTSNEPLMNCTHGVDTRPAVATITITVTPTSSTPDQCGSPISGLTSAPAPTICGIR